MEKPHSDLEKNSFLEPQNSVELVNNPELIEYWQLIRTVESIAGRWEGGLDKEISTVSFDISFGTGDDFSSIRIERM